MWQRLKQWLTEPWPPGASAESPFEGLVADTPMVGSLRFVAVTLQTGTVIRGALAAEGPNALILKAPAVAQFDQASGTVAWQPIDGEAVIPMENVDYYQTGIDAAAMGVQKP